ncbi:hypothetical protein Clacol_008000 [Clathrus columnatus]|uniref:NADP-dependent oxidoreductase domain-containing protein n=1 Tax=Clathrus columnatus TaxID=1419009 RepID=A0AAV5AKT5_9AGAM|nr:hypothetical protein Clacol_008000 [Clathrus columnatus]
MIPWKRLPPPSAHSRSLLFKLFANMSTKADLNIASRIKFKKVDIFLKGVYEMTEAEAERSVFNALEDTAEWYENERGVGKGVRRFLTAHPDIPRSDLFIETKLKTNRGYEQAKKSFSKSLRNLGLEYVDMYLIHSPLGGPQMREESWKALLDLKESGTVRSIGVSNYGTHHMAQITTKRPQEEWPSINQVDVHPFMRHQDIVDFCGEHGILIQTWGPLARGMRFNHPRIKEIADKKGKSPAQIFLRWNIQKGHAPIPKSVRKDRIIENSSIFDWELSDEDMNYLEDLNEDLVTDWDVTMVD